MADAALDAELFLRWRDGDNGAGSALLKRHFSALHRFFSNKARGVEEDLIQNTFMACLEAGVAFRGASSFRTYLLGVARHQLLTHYRKRSRKPLLDFTSASVQDLCTSPSGALLRQQEQQLLARALQQVPLEQQIALELAYWEDLSASEIAEILGIPENTVYSRLSRARTHLREALRRLSDVADERERALLQLVGQRAE